MKKGLLFALALGVGTLSFAQSLSKKAEFQKNNFVKEQINFSDQESQSSTGPVQTMKSNKGALTGVTLGYSNNVYTMLVEQQSCLTMNEDLGLIQFTHRTKVGEDYSGTAAVSSGDIATTYSTDGGDTWTGIMSYPNGTVGNNRYPGGIIYNPAGNTDVANAFTAYVGPVHDGTDWNVAFQGSQKFDGTLQTNTYDMSTNGALMRSGFTVTSDNKLHVIGGTYTLTGDVLIHDTVYMMNAAFNSTNNSFDWSKVATHITSFAKDTDNSDLFSAYWNTAWSADGVTGYYWTTGRDATTDNRSYQPIVWKTTDNGTTWTMMPIFDFSSLTTITDYLQPMQGLTYSRPSFSFNMDGVVDVNGDLHIMGLVKAAFSNSNDSLGYTYFVANGTMSNPIFDVYTTASGWDARHIGDIYTAEVDDTEGGYGDIGWDLRLQAGKTADGTKVFASWTDSDTTIAPIGADGFPINLFPDLYAVGIDVLTGKQTNPTNFTDGTSFYGDFFFHYMSDIIGSDNGTYNIPVTKIEKGADPIDAITHIYVKGISFMDADFVTNPGFKSSIDNIVSVSQNRPNPFSGNTQIDINLDKASNVSINVINITGQSVYEMNYGKRAQGSFTINFNSSNLSSGIYFYTVTAGNSQVTKKMIVR
ncbi:MAG: hypothetical protein B6I18_04015 [Bacteroidetes bacterium 4572_112]|nr:MAG: hypothetical protein B6I18_04015 [Bacteroidetes bacterium 4572_112]